MSTPLVPFIPDSAPFSPEQRAWLNGYLAGLFSRQAVGGVPSPREAPAAPAPAAPLTILFGSQTGTAENLAKKAAKLASARGFAPTVLDAAQADVPRLAGAGALLVITSTYGDGEPPDNAKTLLSTLRGLNGTQLNRLRFSVCGLGDTNYSRFCQCAQDFDAALARLGATRATDRVDCDLDYDGPFQSWLEKSLAALSAGADPAAILAAASIPNPQSEIQNPDEPRFSKKNPFAAPVLAVRGLNAPGSAKEVNHVEFSLQGSGLAYEAGDALGVCPHNCPELVAAVLAALGCDGEETVPAPSGAPTSLRRALTDLYDLGKPAPALLQLLGVDAGPEPAPHDVPDVLRVAPGAKRPAAAAFVGALRKLQPRLYSISSSPRAHPGQVHLTVGAVRYELKGRARKGVCSTFLADRAPALGRAGVFVHRNPNFRLPASGDTPVIMVGPGTGIAPFRAFLQERRATGAKGGNWLFFGDQKSSTDFLYRDELAALQAGGTLTRLDLAWSRDQAAKSYVQHRMVEAATELFRWLEAGAHFYVCGDASRMARDVHAALVTIVGRAGDRPPEQAAEYVARLTAARRYQRDVY